MSGTPGRTRYVNLINFSARKSSFAELYKFVLEQVYTDYNNIVSPRKLEIKELVNATLTLKNPYNNLFESKIRVYPKRYLAGELYWYFTGRNDVAFIKNFSNFWTKISDDGVTSNSAYGHLLWHESPNEWQWAFSKLQEDIDTRQAVIHFNKPYHMHETKDFPCTLTGTFQIRKNKLNLTIIMRSQDVIKGLTFDLPFFTLLLQQMKLNLSKTYPNLKLGELTLFVQSLHLYSSDYELAEKLIISNDLKDDALPILNEEIVSPNGVQVWTDNNSIMNWIFKNCNIIEVLTKCQH